MACVLLVTWLPDKRLDRYGGWLVSAGWDRAHSLAPPFFRSPAGAQPKKGLLACWIFFFFPLSFSSSCGWHDKNISRVARILPSGNHPWILIAASVVPQIDRNCRPASLIASYRPVPVPLISQAGGGKVTSGRTSQADRGVCCSNNTHRKSSLCICVCVCVCVCVYVCERARSHPVKRRYGSLSNSFSSNSQPPFIVSYTPLRLPLYRDLPLYPDPYLPYLSRRLVRPDK